MLTSLWENWKRVAKRVGDFQARALLSIFYFVVLGLFAMVVRWTGDPLAIKPGAAQGWRSKANDKGAPLEQARRQF